MKYASDFRRIAREGLAGHWGIAVIAGLIAGLLGAASGGSKLKINYSHNGGQVDLSIADHQIYSTSEGWLSELTPMLVGGALYILLIGLVLAAVYFVLSSVVSVGYGKFNLDLVDRTQDPELGTLFRYFPHWKNAALTELLKTAYILLWSLLFVIPGIIAAYSYAMTPYILAEHPELTAGDAVRYSRDLMSGNRWRLFCLGFSFIGWEFLNVLTLGIGTLWLRPYKQAAYAAFYRDVSGTEVNPYRPEIEGGVW